MEEHPDTTILTDAISYNWLPNFNECEANVDIQQCLIRDEIPNIIHYICDLEKRDNVRFEYYRYLAVKTAVNAHNPTNVFIWYFHEPFGMYWSRCKSLKGVKCIKINHVPTHIYGKPVHTSKYILDIMRIQLLLKYGGIYLNFDSVSLKSFDELRQHVCVLGKTDNARVSNDNILARPNSVFLTKWLDTYRTYRESDRDELVHRIPFKLSKKYKDEVTLLNVGDMNAVSEDMVMSLFKDFAADSVMYNKLVTNKFCLNLHSRITRDKLFRIEENTLLARVYESLGEVATEVFPSSASLKWSIEEDSDQDEDNNEETKTVREKRCYLFQTLSTFQDIKEDPDQFQELISIMDSWNRVNNVYRVQSSDADCGLSMPEEIEGVQVGKMFRNLIPGAFKTDVWRLCMMYEYGGIYADVHIRCINYRLFNELIATYDGIFVIDNPIGRHCVYNAFMYVKHPKDELCVRILQKIEERVNARSFGEVEPVILDVTGPVTHGRAISECIAFEESESHVHEYGGRKYLFVEHNSHENSIYETISHEDKVLLQCRYKTYRDDMMYIKGTDEHYSDAWERRLLYWH